MTVAAILKVWGRPVETTHADTLYTVAWELRSKNIGALAAASRVFT